MLLLLIVIVAIRTRRFGRRMTMRRQEESIQSIVGGLLDDVSLEYQEQQGKCSHLADKIGKLELLVSAGQEWQYSGESLTPLRRAVVDHVEEFRTILNEAYVDSNVCYSVLRGMMVTKDKIEFLYGVIDLEIPPGEPVIAPVPTPTPPPTVVKEIVKASDRLNSGEYLGYYSPKPLGYLESPNGKYNLQMQSDCNLVLYKNDGAVLWSSGSFGQGHSCQVHMQTDNNLVIYDGTNAVVWSSGTFGKGTGSAHLVVQDDGNLVMYDPTGAAIWNTGTFGMRRGVGNLRRRRRTMK